MGEQILLPSFYIIDNTQHNKRNIFSASHNVSRTQSLFTHRLVKICIIIVTVFTPAPASRNWHTIVLSASDLASDWSGLRILASDWSDLRSGLRSRILNQRSQRLSLGMFILFEWKVYMYWTQNIFEKLKLSSWFHLPQRPSVLNNLRQLFLKCLYQNA